MNPFDEQEARIYLDCGNQLAEAKLKKLYTWHDLEKVREECQNEIERLNGSLSDIGPAYHKEKDRFHWFEFWIGVGLAFCMTATLFTLIYK